MNEYLAWNLHDYDVRQRGIKEGREDGIKEGKISAYAEMVRSGMLTTKDAAEKLGISESELKSRL